MISWAETSDPNCEYSKTEDFVDNAASTGFLLLKPGGKKPNRNTHQNTLVILFYISRL